jgi:hypothetical protein
VMSPVDVSRAYYYCERCRDGIIPKDLALDIVWTPASVPGCGA